MNKEDEIEIIYSFNFFDEKIPSFLKAKKSIQLQLLITNYLSRISNITNIPTIKVETLPFTNKEYIKNKNLIIVVLDISISFFIFLFIFSKIIIEKKEHIFDYLSSQGITFNHNFLSWLLLFM